MANNFLILTLCLAAIMAPALAQYSDNLPVIGVLTQPSDDLESAKYPPSEYSYIAASYIKWVEASGAKAVPIPYDLPEEELMMLMDNMNGLLMPGGDASLWEDEPAMRGFSQLTIVGGKLLEKAIALNNKGKYFPVWATCMSYELVLMVMTNDDKILEHFNSTNHSLNTVIDTKVHSHIFDNLSKADRESIITKKSFYYNHRYGLSPEKFWKTPVLHNFFALTSYARDSNGKQFIATLEAKDYPFYLSQFHPEKNPYEWLPTKNVNRDPTAISVSQALGDFFLAEARKSPARFSSAATLDPYMVYNYPPLKWLKDFV